jgi:hypothetical protein
MGGGCSGTVTLLAAALISGCASNSSSRNVVHGHPQATRRSARLSATSGAGRERTPSMLAFARCMRAHGVPNFPDPKPLVQPPTRQIAQPAPSGGFTANPNSPGYLTASQDCRSLAVAQRVSASQSQQVTAGQLRFAVCLRAHGVPNFPDPTDNAEDGENGSIGGLNQVSPAFRTAEKNCSKFLSPPPGLPSGRPSAQSSAG